MCIFFLETPFSFFWWKTFNLFVFVCFLTLWKHSSPVFSSIFISFSYIKKKQLYNQFYTKHAKLWQNKYFYNQWKWKSTIASSIKRIHRVTKKSFDVLLEKPAGKTFILSTPEIRRILTGRIMGFAYWWPLAFYHWLGVYPGFPEGLPPPALLNGLRPQLPPGDPRQLAPVDPRQLQDPRALNPGLSPGVSPAKP